MRKALLLTLACFATGIAAAQTPANDWSAVARRDIEFAGAALGARHAGMAADLPSVTVPLATGLRIALADAATVRSEQDYRRMMTRFIAAFGDPHTGLYLKPGPRGWTGLLLDREGGRYRVVWSEPGWPAALPPAGAEVQDCDGVWIGTYLQTRVAPFVNHSVEYETTFSTLAQQSMFDAGLGWTPKECVFTLPDGSRKRYALSSRRVPDQVSAERVNAVQRQRFAVASPVGVVSVAPGRYWVGMPDFDGARHGAAYEAVYGRLAALAAPRWVVFDLRGNGGGDSSWGNRALAALFGTPFAQQLEKAGGLEEYMAASEGTAATLKRYLSLPQFAANKAYLEAALVQVEAAMRKGEKLALVDGEPGAADRPLAPAARPHGPRIVALIDRNCFSSCMNFVQQIQAIDDSVVLGEPTIGYSPFGEISMVPLPSGLGQLQIPTAWFKTAQATREPFVPDIAYSGNMADDAAVQRWVGATLDRIDAGQAAPIKASSEKSGSRR
jgi:hypothetical protein